MCLQDGVAGMRHRSPVEATADAAAPAVEAAKAAAGAPGPAGCLLVRILHRVAVAVGSY